MLIIHYTGMKTAADALAHLVDPATRLSAHYLVEEDGRVHALVAEERRAWHAGVSHWAGLDQLNGCSIGIELVNPGHQWGYTGFPERQMAALLKLSQDICQRHQIVRQRVLGHSDVAPARKSDPGELFDWRWLAKAGVGFWPDGLDDISSAATAAKDDISVLQGNLLRLGYGLEVTGKYDVATTAVVTAFQRHWYQSATLGQLDQPTLAAIEIVSAGQP